MTKVWKDMTPMATDDEMKRRRDEAKNVHIRQSFSHARTKPLVVERLKKRRRPPARPPKESDAYDRD
jgi:hypothetical protein